MFDPDWSVLTKAERRDRALSAEGLLLSGQMEDGLTALDEWVSFFCYRIQTWKLKPWGRTGRKLLTNAINALVETGAYDCQHVCGNCRSKFMIMPRETVIVKYDDAFVEGRIDVYRKDLLSRVGGEAVGANDVDALVRKYRDELRSRQKILFRDYEDAVLSELVDVWRGKRELWCNTCKSEKKDPQ
jgi:hypothetical protein